MGRRCGEVVGVGVWRWVEVAVEVAVVVDVAEAKANTCCGINLIKTQLKKEKP